MTSIRREKVILLPSLIVLLLLSIFFFLPQESLTALLGSDAVFWFLAAGVQALATLFAFLLAGYVYFSHSLREARGDAPSVKEINELLRDDFHTDFRIVSGIMGLSILWSLGAIVVQPYVFPAKPTFILVAAGGITLSFILSLAFVLDLTNPDAFRHAAQSLRQKVERAGGDLVDSEEFLTVTYSIETYLMDMLNQDQQRAVPTRRQEMSRMGLRELARLAYSKGFLDSDLYRRLLDIIALRNAILHGADGRVRSGNVEEARAVLGEIEAQS